MSTIGFVIDGNNVIYDTTNSNINVTPVINYNPSMQWTYIYVTSKDAYKLKLGTEYNSNIEWLEVQYYNDGWQNLEIKENKVDKKLKIKVKDFKDYAIGETVQYRIRYKPNIPEGKYNVTIEDDNNNFIDILDPWWGSPPEQNMTSGYVYATNLSFSDRFGNVGDNYNFSTRWAGNNTYFVIHNNTMNGFGFNDTHLRGTWAGNLVSAPEVHPINFSFNNFEVIFQAQMIADTGSDYCYYTISGNGNYGRNSVLIRNVQTLKVNHDDASTTDTGINIGLNNTKIYRVTVNNSITTWYIANISTPETWRQLVQYAATNGTAYYPHNFSMRVAGATCALKYVLVRELLPVYNNQGQYVASFIYDSSNGSVTSWAQYRIQPIKNNVLQSYIADNTPTDNEANNQYFTLDGGNWSFRVRVMNNLSQIAINDSQYLLIDVGDANIVFYDEETQSLLNWVNIQLDIYNDINATNRTVTTGMVNITNLPAGTYTAAYTATGYRTRVYPFTVIFGVPINLTLYMLNSTGSDSVPVHVYESYGQPLEGYNVRISRLLSGVYKLVEISTTNFEGESSMAVVVNVPYYKFQIENDGTIYQSTNQTMVLDATNGLSFYINTAANISERFHKIQDVQYLFYYNNVTRQFYFTYTDPSNSITEMCMDVDYRNMYGRTYNYNKTCTNTATGTIIINITNVSGRIYTAKILPSFSPESYMDIRTVEFPYSVNMGTSGIFFTFLIYLAFMFAGVWNPVFAGILAPLSLWLTKLVGFHQLTDLVLVVLTALSLIISYLVWRNR